MEVKTSLEPKFKGPPDLKNPQNYFSIIIVVVIVIVIVFVIVNVIVSNISSLSSILALALTSSLGQVWGYVHSIVQLVSSTGLASPHKSKRAQ